MSLEVIHVYEVVPQPWRNGGGRTRELWTWPSADAWWVRVSMADIEQDGPFSAFPGVDRWLALVEGAGVVLQLPGGEETLARDSDPLAFDGALAPMCRLLDGATRDLNLMSRQELGRSSMKRVRSGDERLPEASLCAVFTTEPLRLQVGDGDELHLPAWTLAASGQSVGQTWRVRSDSGSPRAWWMIFEPAGDGRQHEDFLRTPATSRV
jgi:environmental stress-induced protein Ves